MTTPGRDELLALAGTGNPDELRRTAAQATPEDAGALVAALAERGDAAALAALDAEVVPKNTRKAARRALHALRAKGVRTTEPERIGRLGTVNPDPATAFRAEAYVAVPPPLAELLLVVRTAADRHLYVGILDEEERVIEGAAFGGATRQGVRDLLARRRSRADAYVPLDPGHVAARLRAAVLRAPSPHGKKAGLGRAEIAEQLPFCEPLADAPHPALALAPDDPAELEAEAAWVIERLDARDLPFALSREQVALLTKRLNAAREAPLIVVPGTEANREAQAFRAFLDEDLPADLKTALGLRLLDRAWVAREHREARQARGEAACGAALLHRPDSNVAQALLLRFAALHVRPPRSTGDENDRHDQPPERRSGGGIILP
ncbi:MAG: hypothetical protein HY907_10430 [Deltaproteobacteria bacterium]|nr:hypothetical protein [Deltaproteobacteria bacterium]